VRGLVRWNAFSQFEPMKTARWQVEAEDPLISFDSQLAGAIPAEELQLMNWSLVDTVWPS
jgi:hypothetical protein